MTMTIFSGRLFQHLVLAVSILFVLQLRVADSDAIRCIEEEREALLVFKQGLVVDESGRLSSWGGENDKRNCCEWRGVNCSQTGHVEGLDLSDFELSLPLKGKINASLLKLNHLKYLDLSHNSFGGSPIPEFIGSLSKLSYLCLSDAQFAGPIPHQLGNLSSLQFLDLSINDNLFNVGNLDWLSHLSSLRYLNLGGNDLSKSTDWFQVVKKLPFLTDLKLNGCNLPPISPSSPLDDVNSTTFLVSLDLSFNNIDSAIYSWLFNISSNLVDLVLDSNHLQGLLPDAFGHMISLSRLSLKSNDYEGVIPKSLGNMSSLLTLDLSSNKFMGSVPEFTRFSSLKDLRLGENHLNGTITKSIGHMSELEKLDLHGNSLKGVIYEDFFLNLTKLMYLDLSHNSLALEFSNDWVPPFHLSYVLLASCKMGPHFPTWLRTQKFIGVLDISNAEISDTIPDWFWDIYPNLVHFNISHNQIKGNLPDFSFLPRFFFAGVDFSSNHLEGPLSSLPSCMSYIDLSGNKFSGPISFICSVCVLGVSHLDLSSNQLSGTLPDCWIKFERLAVLNLANNGLSGTIPHSFGSLRNIQALSLSNNSFSGEFPYLRNCTQLTVVDFQKNALSGKIPEWIGESLQNLVILSLQSNKFHGNIPFQLCRLANIQILDLSLNNITGTIPKCVKNFTALSQERSSTASITSQYIGIVTIGSPPISGESVVSLWLTWKGGEYKYKNTLGLVKSLDLSVNKLDGEVPEEMMSLVGLIALNLSRNNFSGAIPPKIGQLKLLDFLDLSSNQFFGEIPSSLSLINRLSVMDLSNNNLSGKIPIGTQLQSFNASVYEGNLGLCGLPLPKKCPGEEPAQGPTTTKGKEDTGIPEDEFITLGFYVSLALGFIAGFWGVCGTLVLSQSWRHAYFNFLADIRDKIYVTATINFAKLKQRFNN